MKYGNENETSRVENDNSNLEMNDVKSGGMTPTQIKEVLDMAAGKNVNEDKTLQNRFAEMRKEALDHIPQSGDDGGRRMTILWPALGAVSAAFLLVVAMVLPTDSSHLEAYALVDLDVLTEAEDLEMLAGHELEFYVWLEQAMEEQG